MDRLIFALAAVLQNAPANPSALTLAQASASLDGKAQCVTFKWLADGRGTAKAAMSLPVVINGKPVPLQLDTGSNVTLLYGHTAGDAGWVTPGQESFRSISFAIGSTSIDRPTVYVAEDMKADSGLVGTLGLPELVGRLSVIDYPHNRFCLFKEADLPPALAGITYTSADLRNAKFFVPISLGSFHSDAIVFDTGSSALPLNVDQSNWTKLTGRDSIKGASDSYQSTSWGKPVTFSGAPAAGAMTLGRLDLGRPAVFTDAVRPNAFAGWPYRTDGILGNAPLWNGIVVLDMTAKVRIGFIQ